MARNVLLEYVHPHLQDGNLLTCADFEALFSSRSVQEQEQMLADLAAQGVLVGKRETTLPIRKPIARCAGSLTSRQLWSMTNEQLCVLVQQGNAAAMDILTRKNMAFVHLMARRVPQLFAHISLTEEDNFQNGILGLTTAVQHFDALQGYRFLTYAAYWIRQTILREAVNTGLTVRIPVHYFDTLCRVRVICTGCQQLSGIALLQAVAEAEAASGHPCTIEQARRYLSDMSVYLNIASLNMMIGEGYDTEVSSLIADDTAPAPEELAEQRETVQLVRQMLDQLSPRESTVLRLRYGIPDGYCRTLEQVGAQLGITRERVRQIQCKAERRLRQMMSRRSYQELLAA